MSATQTQTPAIPEGKTEITFENLRTALLAPFGGKDARDPNGSPIPSTSTARWTFTLENLERGSHITFRVCRPKGWDIESPVLVDLLTSGDNVDGFTFLGSFGRVGFRRSKKIKPEGFMFVGLRTMNWITAKLDQFDRDGSVPSGLRVLGEDRCSRCGRKLTNPESIKDGLGPLCRTKV